MTDQPTAHAWRIAYLAHTSERQLLIAAAVLRTVDQATTCLREHKAPDGRLPDLGDDERAVALRAFETMAEAIDLVVSADFIHPDDPDTRDHRRTALLELKLACALGVDLLAPDDDVLTASELEDLS